jgi:hypothetical protein
MRHPRSVITVPPGCVLHSPPSPRLRRARLQRRREAASRVNAQLLEDAFDITATNPNMTGKARRAEASVAPRWRVDFAQRNRDETRGLPIYFTRGAPTGPPFTPYHTIDFCEQRPCRGAFLFFILSPGLIRRLHRLSRHRATAASALQAFYPKKTSPPKLRARRAAVRDKKQDMSRATPAPCLPPQTKIRVHSWPFVAIRGQYFSSCSGATAAPALRACLSTKPTTPAP